MKITAANPGTDLRRRIVQRSGRRRNAWVTTRAVQVPRPSTLRVQRWDSVYENDIQREGSKGWALPHAG